MNTLTMGDGVECDTLYTLCQPLAGWNVRITFSSGARGDALVREVCPAGLRLAFYDADDPDLARPPASPTIVRWMDIDDVYVY